MGRLLFPTGFSKKGVKRSRSEDDADGVQPAEPQATTEISTIAYDASAALAAEKKLGKQVLQGSRYKGIRGLERHASECYVYSSWSMLVVHLYCSNLTVSLVSMTSSCR